MECRYCRYKIKGHTIKNSQEMGIEIIYPLTTIWFCKVMPGSPAAINGSIYIGVVPDNCPIVRQRKYRPRPKDEILTPFRFKFKGKGINIKPGVYTKEVDLSSRIIPGYAKDWVIL